MSALTDAYENKEIDFKFRGQALGLANTTAAAGTGPSTWYIGLFTTDGTDAGIGTEVTGGAYARMAVASSLANWAGTQGAGTTTVSTGSSGTTSNNGTITFPTPTAAWGTVVGFGLFDSATGGIECIRAPLTVSQAVTVGNAPTFPPASLSFQCDN